MHKRRATTVKAHLRNGGWVRPHFRSSSIVAARSTETQPVTSRETVFSRPNNYSRALNTDGITGSRTIGNAICPYCGQSIHFIKHNGGSVWLDSLGWPWPKHGCFEESEPVWMRYFRYHVQHKPSPTTLASARGAGAVAHETHPSIQGDGLNRPAATGSGGTTSIFNALKQLLLRTKTSAPEVTAVGQQRDPQPPDVAFPAFANRNAVVGVISSLQTHEERLFVTLQLNPTTGIEVEIAVGGRRTPFVGLPGAINFVEPALTLATLEKYPVLAISRLPTFDAIATERTPTPPTTGD